MGFKREYNYGDVFLVPRKTIVESRKECNTTVKLGQYTFDMPVCAANMKSVINEETCEFFSKKSWFYVMHRFNIDPVKFTQNMHQKGFISSVSVGVNEDSYTDFSKFIDTNEKPDYITLDIANAWCPKAERMTKWIKDTFPNTFLIVGNVATPDAVEEIQKWGADAIKAGIAGGNVCITKNKTGFHRPMVSTILDCVSVAKVPIIADGGIREHGDIAKALVCGAEFVMAGTLFAGYDESAGEIIETDGRHYKEYFGSASQYNKNAYKNVEGKRIHVEYKGSMEKLLVELKEDLQSSISYAGGKDLSALRTCEIITIN